MALSGTKKGTVTQNSGHYEYWLSWSAVQNIAGNYSDVTVTHYWKHVTGKVKTFNTVGSRDYGITIDDGTGSADRKKTGSKVFDYDPWPGDNVSISTFTKRVQHNDDGTKSITISTYANGHASSFGPSSSTADSADCKASVTVELDDIPRKATIVTAPNFNDEQNPTITYNNAAGNSAELLQACISLDGSRDDVVYRDIPKTGSSYTFNLTNAERDVLRSGTPKNSRDVVFYIKTRIGGETYNDSVTRTLSIINANPTLAPEVYDNNEVTKNLTGNNKILVKYYSNAHYVVNASSKKGATISSVKVTHNGKTVGNTSGTWNSVENGTFIFNATDSRGNTAEPATIILQLVDYVKLTCDIGDDKPGLSGNMTVTCSGNYFNGGFGAKNNELTVQYRYKLQNGTYSEWTNMSTNISGQTYTASANVTGLDNKATYVFQTRAIDLLNTSGVNSSEKSVSYTPVFDWGKNDFRVNVDLYVKDKLIDTRYDLLHGYIGTSGVFTLTSSIHNYDEIHIFATTNEYDHRHICTIINVSNYLYQGKYQTVIFSKDDWDDMIQLYDDKIDTSQSTKFNKNHHILFVYGVKY